VAAKLKRLCQAWFLKQPFPTQALLELEHRDGFVHMLTGFTPEHQQAVLYCRYIKCRSHMLANKLALEHIRLHTPRWFFYHLDGRPRPQYDTEVVGKGLDWLTFKPVAELKARRYLFPVSDSDSEPKLHDEVYAKKEYKSLRQKLNLVQGSLKRWTVSQGKGSTRKPSAQRCHQLIQSLETLLNVVSTILRTGDLYQDDVYFPTDVGRQQDFYAGYVSSKQALRLIEVSLGPHADHLRSQRSQFNVSGLEAERLLICGYQGWRRQEALKKLIPILKRFQFPERQQFLDLKDQIMDALRQLPSVGQANLHQVAAQKAAAELAAEVTKQDGDQDQDQDQDKAQDETMGVKGLDAE